MARKDRQASIVRVMLKEQPSRPRGFLLTFCANALLTFCLFSISASCISTRVEAVTSPLPRATPSSTILLTSPTLASPLVATATPATTPFAVPAQADEQVYIDPAGWYAAALPAGWEKSETSYIGDDGFFETGYLPELSFIPRELTVCEWVANIQTKGLYTVSWAGTHGCQLFSRAGISPAVTWEIIENPSADLPHRFLYIQADSPHFPRIISTFTWLRSVDEERKPDFRDALLRPEDAAFWHNTLPLPASFSLKEYALPVEYAGPDPSKKIFLEFVPSEALPTSSPFHPTSPPLTLESVNRSLAKYGYAFQRTDISYLYDLYRNGERVLQNIYRLPEIELFQTDAGEKLIFFAHTLLDPKQSPDAEGNAVSYLIQNEDIVVWESSPLNSMYPGWTPIWVADAPLFLGLGEGVTVQVWNAHHDLVFSFATYFGASVPIEKFLGWNDHWTLEVSNFVVQDGEILNEKQHFEEVFDWFLINDKPFYFYRKGARVGFSYDGQFFSTYYHEVIHGYCCGLALNNPMLKDHTLRFFGRRDGVWYYVVLEFE